MHPVSRRSKRLRLREITPADTDGVLAIYGDAEATRHLSFTPRSRDEVENIVARSITSAEAEPRQEYALAVVSQDDSALIGYSRLALDPHQQSAATIGFALRPDKWGVGFGQETVQLLLGLAFEELDLHRVWAARAPRNVASEKTLLTSGMIEEGVIRGHVRVRGEWRDSIVYGILCGEWGLHRQVTSR